MATLSKETILLENLSILYQINSFEIQQVIKFPYVAHYKMALTLFYSFECSS